MSIYPNINLCRFHIYICSIVCRFLSTYFQQTVQYPHEYVTNHQNVMWPKTNSPHTYHRGKQPFLVICGPNVGTVLIPPLTHSVYFFRYQHFHVLPMQCHLDSMLSFLCCHCCRSVRMPPPTLSISTSHTSDLQLIGWGLAPIRQGCLLYSSYWFNVNVFQMDLTATPEIIFGPVSGHCLTHCSWYRKWIITVPFRPGWYISDIGHRYSSAHRHWQQGDKFFSLLQGGNFIPGFNNTQSAWKDALQTYRLL